jgi:uncharacterized membrane protein
MQQLEKPPIQEVALDEPKKSIAWYDIAVIALCCTGIFIAGYLSYTYIFNQPILCATGDGCEKTSASPYSKFLGVPVRYIGLMGYSICLILSIWRLTLRNTQTESGLKLRERLDWTLFLGGIFGFVFSLYLQSMSIFVIGAICSWCVASAITMTTLFSFYAIRIWRASPVEE